MAQALEQREVLDEVEVEQLIGPLAYRPSLNGQPADAKNKDDLVEPRGAV